MKLDREVHHRSEDVEDQVLLDGIKAIRRRLQVVTHDYDIPYIAGYSVDGHTVFIDRHLPRTFRWLTKTVRVEPFLITHEVIEKTLLDEHASTAERQNALQTLVSIKDPELLPILQSLIADRALRGADDVTVRALDVPTAGDVLAEDLALLHLAHQEEIDVIAGNVIVIWSCQSLPRHRRSDEVGRDDHHEVCLRICI